MINKFHSKFWIIFDEFVQLIAFHWKFIFQSAVCIVVCIGIFLFNFICYSLLRGFNFNTILFFLLILFLGRERKLLLDQLFLYFFPFLLSIFDFFELVFKLFSHLDGSPSNRKSPFLIVLLLQIKVGFQNFFPWYFGVLPLHLVECLFRFFWFWPRSSFFFFSWFSCWLFALRFKLLLLFTLFLCFLLIFILIFGLWLFLLYIIFGGCRFRFLFDFIQGKLRSPFFLYLSIISEGRKHFFPFPFDSTLLLLFILTTHIL